MQSDTTVVSLVAVFFKKAAIIIATHGQKTLHWQLSKVILSSMHDCNFEAINQALNKRTKKLEMEYGPFICTIIFSHTLYKIWERVSYVTFTLKISYVCLWLF